MDSHSSKKNLYIIFIEFDDKETSTIISFLREHEFAPRGHNLDSLEELNSTLSQRSWDLILCKDQQGQFDPFQMTKQLLVHEKDIPVLQLVENLTQDAIKEGLINRVQAVLPLNDLNILLLCIQREIAHLQNRRDTRSLQLQLSESQKRCKTLMDCSSLAICFIFNQKIVYLNDAFAHQLGYQIKDLLLYKPVFNLLASQESDGLNNLLSDFQEKGQTKQSYQVLAKREDNSHFTAHIQLKHVHFNNNNCIEISLDQKRSRKDENTFSKLDPTTGLYNLSYFNETLETQIRQTHQGGSDCHLIYIKLVNFDEIKSQFGNQAIRSVSRDIADILAEHFCKTHIKSRLSADTFCVLYLEPSSDTTLDVAKSIANILGQHNFDFEEQVLTSDTLFAVIPLTDTAPNVEQLYNRGKIAIDQLSKQTESDSKVTLFNIENLAARNELQSIAKVEHAIEQDNLRLLYQPLVPLALESEQQHYEVLLRMIGENNESIPPNQFLTSVGHANLDEEMDRWVLKRSINRFKIERNQNKSLKLFISVTDTVWERQELLLWLSEELRQSRIEADCIVIQISETESAAKLSEAKFFVDGLRELNCLVGLKHYGSTNHSKNILKALDPDYIKLDGSYITELSESGMLHQDLKLLLTNLKALGKVTIAPQVETPKIMSLLWKSGVCMIQGYYLQEPEEEMNYEF